MLTIRVVSYNICHAQGMDDRVDLNRLTRVLASTGAHMMGLQEVDKHHPRSFFADQARSLGQQLQKQWAFGVNLHWGLAQYGNATLSCAPILQYRQHLLSSKNEQRGLLEAEILLCHRRVYFYCTHLGLNREEREEQVQEILQIVGRSQGPVILVGDFNDTRDSQEYGNLCSVLQDATAAYDIKSYPANSPQEQIDFIFTSPDWQVQTAGAVSSDASDHLPVWADLRLT